MAAPVATPQDAAAVVAVNVEEAGPTKFERALAFASRAHQGTFRKGAPLLPYIVHPMAVASLVRQAFHHADNLEDLMCAALLHDVVEDCQVTVAELQGAFGTRVASLVDELTSDPNEVKRMGKTAYLQQKMTTLSSCALSIKLCDRIDNLADADQMPQLWRQTYFQSTAEIIRALRDSKRALTQPQEVLVASVEEMLSNSSS